MRLLYFEEFVNEKLDIKPVTKTRLADIRNSRPKNSGDGRDALLNKISKANYYWSMGRFVPEKRVFSNIETMGIMGLSEKTFLDAIEATRKRFKSWVNLSSYEQVKKHKQRAAKKMTAEKVFATLFAAIRMYGAYIPHDTGLKEAMNHYIDRVESDWELTDEDVMAIYNLS